MKYGGITWAGLHVEDLDKAVTFYRDILDLPLLRKGENAAHMDASNSTLFELFSGGLGSDAPRQADQQPLVISLNVDDIDSAIDTLKGRGVDFIGVMGERGSRR